MKSLHHYYNQLQLMARVALRERAFRSARDNMLASTELTDEQKQLLAKTSLRTSRHDEMYYPGYEEVYLRIGLSAMLCIDTALERAGRTEPVHSVLDFPCGHGRVLRSIRARFPQAQLTAGDLKPSMLDFAQKTFDATPFRSHADIANLSIDQRFDLIWCGSLVTHLDEARTEELLRFFYNHLNPGGVCVFSAHGSLSAQVIEIYGLSKAAEKKVLDGYHQTGYGYADYDNFDFDHYGVSIVTHGRMTEIASGIGAWHEVMYAPYGWDRHHDVYAYMKE